MRRDPDGHPVDPRRPLAQPVDPLQERLHGAVAEPALTRRRRKVGPGSPAGTVVGRRQQRDLQPGRDGRLGERDRHRVGLGVGASRPAGGGRSGTRRRRRIRHRPSGRRRDRRPRASRPGRGRRRGGYISARQLQKSSARVADPLADPAQIESGTRGNARWPSPESGRAVHRRQPRRRRLVAHVRRLAADQDDPDRVAAEPVGDRARPGRRARTRSARLPTSIEPRSWARSSVQAALSVAVAERLEHAEAVHARRQADHERHREHRRGAGVGVGGEHDDRAGVDQRPGRRALLVAQELRAGQQHRRAVGASASGPTSSACTCERWSTERAPARSATGTDRIVRAARRAAQRQAGGRRERAHPLEVVQPEGDRLDEDVERGHGPERQHLRHHRLDTRHPRVGVVPGRGSHAPAAPSTASSARPARRAPARASASAARLAREAVARLALERRRARREHLGRQRRRLRRAPARRLSPPGRAPTTAIPPPERAISSYGIAGQLLLVLAGPPARERQMRVAVDEPRHHRAPRRVDRRLRPRSRSSAAITPGVHRQVTGRDRPAAQLCRAAEMLHPLARRAQHLVGAPSTETELTARRARDRASASARRARRAVSSASV